MLRLKRLDTFLLQTFLPVFCMTFLICLFIVLMQFLWQYVDEMVGKGLEITVLAELFFYAGLSMVPMALPLAVLLGSLMTFGNLAERLELLAMKAAGISLIRIMLPLIITVCVIATGAFFFQNEVLPRSQVKMFSLLYAIRNKSPELDIPEGVFYKEIQGFNLYVQHKNRETGMLYDVMIYDLSGNFEDATVIVADSGQLKMTADKQFLFLTLYDGESFENLKDQRTSSNNVPYRRESFTKKDILIEFDANFNRMDDSFLSNMYVGKNMDQLLASIDSLNVRNDSISMSYGEALKKDSYFKTLTYENKSDSALAANHMTPVDIDSIFIAANIKDQSDIAAKALSKASAIKQDFSFKESVQREESKSIRRHEIEMHQKFTLSFACLIFFFIGAPLGAIIGKGGLGMPVIVSVFLFIIYYIIDNTGYKLARDGQMTPWEGRWLSSAILLPLGIFFTIKAVNDSALFNSEVYVTTLRNFFGLQKRRTFKKKEVIIETLDKNRFANDITAFDEDCEKYLRASEDPRSISFFNFFSNKYAPTGLEDLVVRYNLLLEMGSNSADEDVLKRLSDTPVLYKMNFGSPANNPILGLIVAFILPVSIPYYLFAIFKRKKRLQAIRSIIKNNQELLILLRENNK